MDWETARAIVDFAFTQTPPDEGISIGFFGGEPILCLGTIRRVVDYAKLKEKLEGKSVLFNVVSNGTLLDQEILDYFNEEQIKLCVSIDGPRNIHNNNRLFANGRGSFDKAKDGLRRALKTLNKVQVNSVFGPRTVDNLWDTLSFLTGEGVYAIHLNPDVMASWTQSDFPALQRGISRAADFYIESYEHGHEIGVNLIDSKIIVLLKGGYQDIDKCGLGKIEWAFAPSGNAYPCERLIGDDNNDTFCLGNIHTGVDIGGICQIAYSSQNSSEECQKCNVNEYCMNWCFCTNFLLTGFVEKASPALCVSERTLIAEARRIAAALKDNDLFVNHFLNYLSTNTKKRRSKK